MGVQGRLNDMRIFGLRPGWASLLQPPSAPPPALRWRDTVGPPLRRKTRATGMPQEPSVPSAGESAVDPPPSRPGASQGHSRPSPARMVQGTLFDDF